MFLCVLSFSILHNLIVQDSEISVEALCFFRDDPVSIVRRLAGNHLIRIISHQGFIICIGLYSGSLLRKWCACSFLCFALYVCSGQVFFVYALQIIIVLRSSIQFSAGKYRSVRESGCIAGSDDCAVVAAVTNEVSCLRGALPPVAGTPVCREIRGSRSKAILYRKGIAARNLSDETADITVSADVVAALRRIIYSILIFSVRRTAADVTIRNPAIVVCTVQISDESSETCRVGGILRIGTGHIY